MTALTLKDIPPKLLRSLRAAAESDRRSVTQEIIYLLEVALRDRVERTGPAPDVQAQLAAWRKLAEKWQSDVDPPTEADRVMKRRTAGRKVEL